MLNMWKKIGGLMLVIIALTVAAGCQKTFNVIVSADDPSIINKTVEIDLVGVNQFDKAAWNSYSMTEYWQRDNPQRLNAIKTSFKFGSAEPTAKTLKKNDPIWKLWKNNKVAYLFVMANLPGDHKDMPGSADDRRLSVTIEKKCWGWFANTIEIDVNSSRATCLTLPKKCPIE
jgi:hypothetical protein